MFAFHHVRNIFDRPAKSRAFVFGVKRPQRGLRAGAVIPMRQAGWLTGASINAPSDLPFPCEPPRWQGPAYAVRNRRASGSQLRRPYFGGCSSLLSQLITRSVFSGSGRSQSKRQSQRCPAYGARWSFCLAHGTILPMVKMSVNSNFKLGHYEI